MNQRLPLLLFLPMLFYLAIPTANYYWDGVAYAIDIEKQPPLSALLHPSHLLYAWCGAILYNCTQALGIHARALFLLQFVNGLLAGCCVLLLHVCLKRSGLPQSASIPAALIFAFSATWWRFAGDANPYVPSIFFLLLSYCLLLARPRTVLAGMALACAMLQHELAILFLPAAIFMMDKNRRASFAAAVVLPVAVIYPIAYSLTQPHATITGFLAWLTRHSPDSGFSFHFLESFFLSLRGTLRLFFGGKLGDFTRDNFSIACLVALLPATLNLVFVLRSHKAAESRSLPLNVLLVWMSAYVAFLLFWMPQNTFYRLFYLAPFIAIAATALCSNGRLLIACVPILFLWNFAFVIHPQSRMEFNIPLRFALSKRAAWPATTPIVFHKFHPDLWTISYFNPQASWIGLETLDLSALESRLAAAQSGGKTLWLEQSAYDLLVSDVSGREWLAAHESPTQLILFGDAKHDFRFHCIR